MPLKIDLVATDSDPKVRDDRSTAPGRLLDLMVLTLAIDAYNLAGDDQGHLNKGLALYRQHRGSIEEAAKKHLEGLMDRADAGTVRSRYRLMEAVDPTKKARFVEDFLVWLKHRTTLMRDVFPGRAYTNAVRAASACEESDLELRLQKLSLVPTSSGMSAMFKWVRSAADSVGAPPPITEAVAVQVESANAIVDEIRQVDVQLTSEPKGTERYAELQDQKLDLSADLNEAIEESDDPPAVTSQAVGRMAAPSKIAAEFGLTPEQERVLGSMGEIVIPAGAGSGKTTTMVATIASLVRDRGYRPEQIMACSFTRAASAELQARVENRAGVRGAVLGTTHSMARGIIERARPGLANAVRNVKSADKLFKIAMKQVPLSVQAYAQALEQNKDLLRRIEAIPGWRSKDILLSFHTQLSRGKTLSEKQLAVITKFESGGWGGRRYAEEAPMVEAVRAAMATTAAPVEGQAKVANEDRVSPFWTTPVGQWFNVGQQLTDNVGKPIGEKRAKLEIENYKNSGVTVEQARAEFGDTPMVALYGAYEWLKRNDPVLSPAMDYTDQLIVALNILKTDPAAREAEQRRHKIVIVDEAQDLNQIQNEMFDILGEKADMYARVGDDKQCVAEDTSVGMPGPGLSVTHEGQHCRKLARDLLVGDPVLSYRNGEIVPQLVRHVKPSAWTWGYKITTESGKSLTMSPNHKIWATDVPLEDDQMLVYMMYRRDLGFRVGITNKSGTNEDYLNRFGGRAFMEKAERLWVLEVCKDREEALYHEEAYSLTYGIPTACFEGENRGLNQARLNRVFESFGKNGAKLIEAKGLSFDLPHWMSRSYSKHGRTRRTIQMIAHASAGTQVSMEWMGDDLDDQLHGVHVTKTSKGTNRIRKWFVNYREALTFAEELQTATKANLARRISTPEGPMNLYTASGLFPGMKVLVQDPEAGVVQDAILTVEKVDGVRFVDIDVNDASNFFGGGILSHNSIYGFRGAKPSIFVNATKKAGVKVLPITMNFRSGKAIVDSANKLIAHNEDRQIPMVCDADVDRKGQGAIKAKTTDTHEDAADQVAQEIKDAVDAGDSPKDFGVLVRNNAEADAYTLSLLVRGIPYRMLKQSEGGYFGRPLVKALTAWMRLVIGGSNEEINDAVVEAHMTPGFGLDKQFASGLSRNARGMSYLDYISSGKPVYMGKSDWLNKRVAEYVGVIRTVRLQGGMDSPSLIRAILSVKGTKGTFEEALMRMVDEDDIIEEEGSEASEDALRNAAMAPLRPLMTMAENFKDPANLLAFIQKMKAANEKAQKKTPTDKDDWKEPAVLIGTVHGWKGLEAKHVYVSMAGGVFPNFKTDDVANQGDVTAYDEERRLAYVAITRGENSVTIMSPSRSYLGKESSQSRFVSEACIPVDGTLPRAPEVESEPEGEEDYSERAVESSRPFKSTFASAMVSWMHRGSVVDEAEWES